MKVRDLIALGVAATLVAAPAFADEAPLAAGGPAAQSEGGMLGLSTATEVAAAAVIATVAGLALLNNDSSTATTTH